MNGTFFHASATSSAAQAVHFSSSQVVDAPGRCRDLRVKFTKPCCGSNIVFQSCAETTVGTAHGMKIAALTTARPRNFLSSAMASASATIVSSTTETAVKPSVRHRDGRNSWSVKSFL